tara:strand:- start:725 stop:1000 length:276 start_codon:yes stop_codon:yes gene_type:complete
MKFPWSNDKVEKNVKEDKPKKKSNNKDIQQEIFEFDGKKYNLTNINSTAKKIVMQIKSADQILSRTKSKIKLLKNSQNILISSLRKNLKDL